MGTGRIIRESVDDRIFDEFASNEKLDYFHFSFLMENVPIATASEMGLL